MTPLRRALAIGLLAAAGLLFEIAWTRVAGLVLFGDAAYVVVSLAVLGLAAGAALGALRPALLAPRPRALAAGAAAIASAGALLIVLAAAGRGGAPLLLALGVPAFVALGLAVAGAFADAAEDGPRLYRADLLGAGAGAAASVPLLGLIGAPDTVLVAAALAAAAGATLAPASDRALAAGGLVLAGAVGIAGLATAWPQLDVERLVTPKPMQTVLEAGGQLQATRWGTLGRSDLVRRADGARVLYLDGGAGSLLPDADTAGVWRADPSRFPFLALGPERVFVVGAGAGLEVAHARETGVERVVAAEVNGAGVALARARSDDDPFRGATLHRDEARSVLRASGAEFDLITLAQAVTQTAEPRHVALVDANLYTVEAFATYFDHLADGGAVALELYDELTLTRALATVLATLRAQGIPEAEGMRHLLAVLDTRTPTPTPLLLAFEAPLSPQRALGLARAAENGGLALLYVPGLLENPPLDRVADGRLDLEGLVALEAEADVSPVTDASPFFWSFERGLPEPVRRMVWVVVAVIAVGAVASARGARGAPREARAEPVVFGLLGAAFLATEILALARVQGFLGHPAAALAVTLGALLVGGGVGSGLARRLPGSAAAVAGTALAAGAAALAWSAAWPTLAGLAGAWPVGARGALAAVTLLPVGLFLGAPFPLALRRAGARGAAPVARAWAVSGVGSVAGTVGATALAHLLGFGWVGPAAAAAYALAALTAAAAATRQPDRTPLK